MVNLNSPATCSTSAELALWEFDEEPFKASHVAEQIPDRVYDLQERTALSDLAYDEQDNVMAQLLPFVMPHSSFPL